MKTKEQIAKEWDDVMKACLKLIDDKMTGMKDSEGKVDQRETVGMLSSFASLTYSIVDAAANAFDKDFDEVLEIMTEATRKIKKEEDGHGN